MARFGKSNDPFEERERELRRQRDRLEADLRRLASPDARAHTAESKGSVRRPVPPVAPLVAPRARGEGSVGSYFNEQGIRKFDLIGCLQRIGRFLSGPTGYNRQMIRMLAAGSIDGLPVLRRERKKALVRFLFLFSLLLAILWGIGFSYFRDR